MASAEFFCLWGKPGVGSPGLCFMVCHRLLFVIFSMSNTGPATQLALTTVVQHSEKSLLWQCEMRVSVSSLRHSVPQPTPVFFFSSLTLPGNVQLVLTPPLLHFSCTSLFSFSLSLALLLPLTPFCLTKARWFTAFEIVIWPRHIHAPEAFSRFSHCTFFSHGGDTLNKGCLLNVASEGRRSCKHLQTAIKRHMSHLAQTHEGALLLSSQETFSIILFKKTKKHQCFTITKAE